MFLKATYDSYRRNIVLIETKKGRFDGHDEFNVLCVSGASADLFTHVLYNTYSPPSGYCFDVVCGADPIVDDLRSPEYNVEEKVND